MDATSARVDELMSQLTTAEKAGQLTQYFYFRLPATDAEPALGLDPTPSPAWWRRRWSAARSDRCCS